MTKPGWLTGISRNVFILGLVSFFTDLSSEMLYPIIPIFLTATLGATPAIVGVIEGLAESTASILKLFSGWLSDRRRLRVRCLRSLTHGRWCWLHGCWTGSARV